MLADKSHWRYEERRKGVTARVIDSESLSVHIRKIIELTYGWFDGIEKCAVESLVFVETPTAESSAFPSGQVTEWVTPDPSNFTPTC
jgi:hypothetical protein